MAVMISKLRIRSSVSATKEQPTQQKPLSKRDTASNHLPTGESSHGVQVAHCQRHPAPSLLAILLLVSGCDNLERYHSAVASTLEQRLCFERHIIDDSGAGADGVHMTDVNQDGYQDVVSGWEESGELKLYLHPGAGVQKNGAQWTQVDIRGGQDVIGIEDAAFADLDLDGSTDAVVSVTEGKGRKINRRVRIHYWDRSKPLTDPASWEGSVLIADLPTDRFMKVRVAQIDGKNGADLVVASRDLIEYNGLTKETSIKGGIFLYSSPQIDHITKGKDWKRIRLADIHKGKSIELLDMDGDEDIDILYAGARNIGWLKNPGTVDIEQKWENNWIGSASDLAVCDVDADGKLDIVATASAKEYPLVARWFKRLGVDGKGWRAHDIRIQAELDTRFYRPDHFSLKSIACGHFRPNTDGSGPVDVAITTSGSGYGIFVALAPVRAGWDNHAAWTFAPIEEYEWVMKYDNILALDMDDDGDDDLLTTEENEGLFFQGAGVLWYENQPCQ